MIRVASLVFACYSAACRPPGSGGTGGSISGPVALVREPLKLGDRDPAIVAVIADARAAVAGFEGIVIMETDSKGVEYETRQYTHRIEDVETAVNAAGAALRGAVQREIEQDEPLQTIRLKMMDTKAAYDQPDLWENPRFRHDNTPEVQAALLRDDQRRRRQLFNEMVELREAYRQRRAAVITGVVGQYREMGGQIAEVPKHKAVKRGQSTNQVMTFAQGVFPKGWVDRSNAEALRVHTRLRTIRQGADGTRAQEEVRSRIPLVFRMTSGARAHYQERKLLTEKQAKYEYDRATKKGTSINQVDELTLDGTPDTAVHELWHRMEHMHPTIGAIESRFLDRRSAGAGTRRLRDTVTRAGFRSDEVHTPAGLFHPYAEKRYTNSQFTEVGSMGWEYFVTGKTYQDGRFPDDDHVATVLGIVATVGGN